MMVVLSTHRHHRLHIHRVFRGAHSPVTLLFLLRGVLVGAAGDDDTDSVHGSEASHILSVRILATFLFFVSETCLLLLWLRDD